MIDDEYDVDPDQPSGHPDAPGSPFDGEDDEPTETKSKMRRPSGNPMVYGW